MSAIGARIDELRKLKGMTKKLLAEKIGVNINTISYWNKDTSMPTLENIEKICEVFGISVEQFFTGMGETATESEKFLQEWRVLSDDEKSALNGVMSTFKKLRKKATEGGTDNG